MAEFDNLSEINDNFDTIKTLLNSIRAQGILNTSDVDKLLTGINTKLEKINTDEDIDLIKIFLSELKETFEERHSALISKFSAIESLFTTLLKNSSETLKTAEIKELFDIVATNLSVFSREVVAQKESLTDISLRLDALRSDDTDKKDIIKNITLLKPDLERLSNGFDSIVLSLNDNFKVIIKTITELDKTEHLDKFADSLSSIEMSSKTVLSAIQMLDKKSSALEEVIKNSYTKEDAKLAESKLFELSAQGQELKTSLDNLSDKYLRIDNLADKIDASVNIIASLKAVMSENEDKNTTVIIERINDLSKILNDISTDTKFEIFKNQLEALVNDVISKTDVINNNVVLSNTLQNDLLTSLRALDINVNLQNLQTGINESVSSLKLYIDDSNQKLQTLDEANIARVVNDLNDNTNNLSSAIVQAQSDMSILCEKNFNSIYEHIKDLRAILSQIDENSISANNAVFSNITDRLTAFETELNMSLKRQEDTVNNSTSSLAEQVDNIKNIANILDYKIDSSVLEMNSAKNDFSALKSSVDNVLALDFVNVVKDLRVDLYASKQELANNLEHYTGNCQDNLTVTLTDKYDSLISKLDIVNSDFQRCQAESLNSVKSLLDAISASIIDVISYVSEIKNTKSEDLDFKLSSVKNSITETSLNYIESVRAIVDVVRVQVENTIQSLSEVSKQNLSEIKQSINESKDEIKKDLQYSYSKLLEIQDLYNDVKDLCSTGNIQNADNFAKLIDFSDAIKVEYATKISEFKTSVLNAIDNSITAHTNNAQTNFDKIETKIIDNTENIQSGLVDLYGKTQENTDVIKTDISDYSEKILNELNNFQKLLQDNSEQSKQTLITQIDNLAQNLHIIQKLISENSQKTDSNTNVQIDKVIQNINTIKELMSENSQKTESNTNVQIDKVIHDIAVFEDLSKEKFDNIEAAIACIHSENSKELSVFIDELRKQMENLNIDDKTTQAASLAKILENFVSLKEFITVDTKSSSDTLKYSIELLEQDIKDLQIKLSSIDENIDEDLTRQISLLENNFESIANQIVSSTDIVNARLADNLKNEFQLIATDVDNIISAKLEEYRQKLEGIFSRISDSAELQTDILNKNFKELDISVQTNWNKQAEENSKKLCEVADNIKALLSQNTENVSENMYDLQQSIQEICDNIKIENDELKLKTEEITNTLMSNKAVISEVENTITNKLNNVTSVLFQKNDENHSELNTILTKLAEQVENEKQTVELYTNTVSDVIKEKGLDISNTLEQKANSIISEITAQAEELRQAQENDIIRLSSKIEDIIGTQIYNNIEDLKSYLDVKSNDFDLKDKFDNLKLTMTGYLDDITSDMNKMLDASVFTTAMSDYRLATEMLINSAVDRLNNKFETFIEENINSLQELVQTANQNTEQKLTLFDKKFSETVVDKFEEVKLLSNTSNEAFSKIQELINEQCVLFNSNKEELEDKVINFIQELKDSVDVTSNELSKLTESFENLRLQLSNKDFDEAFKASVEKQIKELEAITEEQFDYIKDISDMCADNLPDISKLEIVLKDSIANSVNQFTAELNSQDIVGNIDSLIVQLKNDILHQLSAVSATREDVSQLTECFESLRSQISSKTFDEAFQASIEKQVKELETLVDEQLGYVKDINDMCAENLPDIPKIEVVLKESIANSVNQFASELNSQNIVGNIDNSIKQLKTDIINQLLNVFNQISFVSEQEEILDFIDEKHSELISILSKIVTSNKSVDNKLNELKENIVNINDKVNMILSSEGDIDYVYSLQDLESDIANLRLALNDMKQSLPSQEITDLAASANKIYDIVEAIKTDLPTKKDIDLIAEDIVSISSRTNRLLLTSDESYKSLQDNLQDFKLVINDLDERTRNFAQESGMDKIDAKLNSINTMIKSGAKTNQVFNDIFEYLAEWVDNAGNQINAISDKINSLDEIEQIKTMLAEIKANSTGNDENIELIKALEMVFSKQAKKMSSLEAKLDKMMIENAIYQKANEPDMKPIEDTLNKFLIVLGDKITEQQAKIDTLENKMNIVLEVVDKKETEQLTKKIGSMDKQIVKLNKSIEKIAENVIEK